MEYGAIDLHKRESQIRIVTEGGQSWTAGLPRLGIDGAVLGSARDADSGGSLDGE
jgi:hypothetical protein